MRCTTQRAVSAIPRNDLLLTRLIEAATTSHHARPETRLDRREARATSFSRASGAASALAGPANSVRFLGGYYPTPPRGHTGDSPNVAYHPLRGPWNMTAPV